MVRVIGDEKMLNKSKGNNIAQLKYQQSPKGKETKRLWRQRNKDKLRELKRLWATSDNGKTSARQWYKKTPSAMYKLYRKSAERRGLEFNITLEDFVKLLKQDCVYCGDTPPMDSGRNGLDRVDNSAGYSLNNVVSCCIKCNRMKGKLSRKEYYGHIWKVLNHLKEQSHGNE